MYAALLSSGLVALKLVQAPNIVTKVLGIAGVGAYWFAYKIEAYGSGGIHGTVQLWLWNPFVGKMTFDGHTVLAW